MTRNDIDSAPATSRLLWPSTLLVLFSNLIPLIGVFYWGWDTFVLLMLYWLETLVIAFWTLIRILVAADLSRSFFGEVIGRVFMFCFFLVHAGGFMAGHFAFLWGFFAGEWATKIHVTHDFLRVAPVEFWHKMVLANGLLIPLAISFAGRGIAFFFEIWRLPLWKRLTGDDPGKERKSALVGGLYTRIVIMHLVILAGAALSQKFGALAPLILLVAMKTIVDLWLFIFVDLKGHGTVPTPATHI